MSDGLVAFGNSVNGAKTRSPLQNATLGRGENKGFQPRIQEIWKKLVKEIENDAFWYHSLGVPPPRNYSPGLIPILKDSLISLRTDGKVTRAVLCHERVVHISKTLWDTSWGCGYRNFLMLCTGLYEQRHQPLYLPLLDASPAPSVRNLQTWIQLAWDNGFDATGRQELRNKLVGTRKWIGTAEIYTALSYRGIPAELMDFTGLKNCADVVIQWMVNYFTPENEPQTTNNSDILDKTTPVVITQLMPVILQHRGHSRVIVGYQQDTDGVVDLLTFDTGRLLPRTFRRHGTSIYGSMDRFAIGLEVKASGTVECEGPSTGMLLHHGEQVASACTVPTMLPMLTPSGMEFSRGIPEDHHEGIDKGTKAISRLKFKCSKQDKAIANSPSMNLRRLNLSVRRLQKAFRLTAQELALNTEYQVLYVPLRPPLTEVEKLGRKVVKCKRARDDLASNFGP